MSNYLRENFPRAAALPRTVLQSTSVETLRKTSNVMRYWDQFVSRHEVAARQVVTVSDVVGYMFFRVLGNTDEHLSGSLSLASFLNGEAACLERGLKLRAESGEVDLQCREFRKDLFFKNAIAHLQKEHSENLKCVHARPIWFEDEERLLAAASADTAGLQDRALIRLLLNSGSRGASIVQIRWNEHIWYEEADFDGRPALHIKIPGSKTLDGTDLVVVLKDEACEDVKKWVDRRRKIHTGLENKTLFITRYGEELSPPGITMMIRRLSTFAGYGEGFFTAHSGRMGYACRVTAEEYSKGHTTVDIFDRLASMGLWAHGSKAIQGYCQTSVRRYFDGRRPLTWEQFKLLSPEILHHLHPLNSVIRRQPVWFEHDQEVLYRICESLGLEGMRTTANQARLRRAIGQRMYRGSEPFRSFVDSLETGKGSRCEHAMAVVSLMIELGYLSDVKSFDSISVTELYAVREKLVSAPGEVRRSRKQTLCKMARQVRAHKLVDVASAIERQNRLKRRTRNKQVDVGHLAYKRAVILGYPAHEASAQEVRDLPRLEDLPDYPQSPSPSSSSDRPLYPPSPVASATSLTLPSHISVSSRISETSFSLGSMSPLSLSSGSCESPLPASQSVVGTSESHLDPSAYARVMRETMVRTIREHGVEVNRNVSSLPPVTPPRGSHTNPSGGTARAWTPSSSSNSQARGQPMTPHTSAAPAHTPSTSSTTRETGWRESAEQLGWKRPKWF